MKTLAFCMVVLLFVCNTTAQYLNQSTEFIARNKLVDFSELPYHPGDPPSVYSVFDLTEIDSDNRLDFATGQNLISRNPNLFPRNYYNFGDWRANTGGTPTYTTLQNFLFKVNDYRPFTDASFGNLRLGQKKDLALGRSDAVEIYRNQSNTLTGPVQSISLTSQAVSISWGAFNYQDTREDLAVATGGQVKIYRNDGIGTLDANPYPPFSISASKILFAQMNADLFSPNASQDKLDLVSIGGNVISLNINSNNNQFDTVQAVAVSSFTNGIKDIAVGDLNNDGWNDVVVTSNYYSVDDPILAVFLNNGQGRLNTTATFALQYRCCYLSSFVAIADMGSPGGVGSRNDGWNDIVFVGRDQTGVLINTRSSPFFNQTPDQEIITAAFGFETTKQIRLADINNTGGPSVIISWAGGASQFPSEWSEGDLRVYKHTGNPAPAPPKNVQVTATPPDQFGYRHPKVSWAANTERDINGYDVWRRITGQCGNGTPYYLGSTPGTDYTDMSIGTAGMGSDCRAWYKVQAKDNATPPNYSDFSPEVWIDYANFWLKRNGNDGGTLSAPATFALREAYPNPFNPSTEIKFDLPEDGFITLNVFDVLGRRVGELVNGNYAAGYHSATWNASNLASGVYFARFTATDEFGKLRFSKINKLILSK